MFPVDHEAGFAPLGDCFGGVEPQASLALFARVAFPALFGQKGPNRLFKSLRGLDLGGRPRERGSQAEGKGMQTQSEG